MQNIDETFQDDINLMWTRKLIWEFYYINNIIEKKLGFGKRLKDPNFVYNCNASKWGIWNASTRTIILSYELLRNYEWDAVVHTLKHETAHMIVSEIFMKDGVNDNNQSHGELFAKACKILGIDASSTHSSIAKGEYQIPEKEKILGRIYKLFCLGESNYKDEAEAAINKAHELMVKYNISIKELPKEKRSFVCRPVGYAYKKVPQYIKSLSRIISDYYFVKYIYMHWGHRGHYVELYGEPHNVDIAEYVFHFLIHEGERQWKEFQKTPEYLARFDDGIKGQTYDRKNGGLKEYRKGNYNKVAFICGVYAGFSSSLEKRDLAVKKQIDPTNTLPILKADPLLKEKFNAQYHPCSWHSSGGSRGGGYSEGANVGKNIVVSKGVTRGSKIIGALTG